MTGSSIPRLQTASLPSSACEPRRSSAIVLSFRVFSLDPLLTLSLFWYLLETVVECHYTQTSLLPHLDCVLDSTDNVCRARPPLPSLQYNLLHQKLSLLNCCIEEKRNNAHSDDLSESDDDDPIYFDQYQTPITDDSLSPNPQTPSIEPDLSPTNEVPSTETNEVPSMDTNEVPSTETSGVPSTETSGVPSTDTHDSPSQPIHTSLSHPTPQPSSTAPDSPRDSSSDPRAEPAVPSVKVPLGKGIYNWSGWYLLGSHEPCWIPITKDKDILTVPLLAGPHS